MSTGLPPWLAAALREDFSSGGGRDLAARAGRLSAGYRHGAPSSLTIGSTADARAYAVSRMPATYAAVASALGELLQRAPAFLPASLLDAGAGPGTASWAARETWPDLQRLVLLDRSRHLLRMARTLSERAGAAALSFVEGDLDNPSSVSGTFDLVLMAYALTELPETSVGPVVARLWAATSGALAIIEPGRPSDYSRLMTVRGQLVAAGATIVAPCPHQSACPLPEGGDWCHFSVRLPRSRDHRRLKGGTLGFEDEKFGYLLAVREAIAVRPTPARVIKPTHESRTGVDVELCTVSGIDRIAISGRNKAAQRAARRLKWGDAVDPLDLQQQM